MSIIKTFFIVSAIAVAISASAQTWTPQNSHTLSDLNDIYYVNNTTGWAFGDSTDILGGYATGVVLKSINMGVPWGQQSMGSPVYQIEDSYFLDPGKGFAVGRNKLSGNGAIVGTMNGGVTWTPSLPLPERLVGIYFYNPLLGWTVGRNDYVLRTVDGGNNWTDVSANTGDHLNGVYFTTANNGWVVGKAGDIAHSVDSGSTWMNQNSGTGQELFATWFVNDSTGWAVGKGGTIVFTNDSGLTWTAQNSNTPEDLFDVTFVNDTTGWAVGTAGTVIKTTDAGIIWTAENSGTTEDITAITMRSAVLGWFCATKGVIHVYAVTPPNAVNDIVKTSDVDLYPNPASDILRLTLPNTGNWQVKLFDMFGRQVFETQFSGVYSTHINRGNWDSGLYLLQLTNESGSSVTKQVVFN